MTNVTDQNVSSAPPGQAQSPVQPVNTPQTASAPNKNPLDILEEMLQQKGGADDPAPTSPSVDSVAEEAAQLAEVKAMEEQRVARDQAELTARQAELAMATQSTEYQARVQQDQATQEKSSADAAASRGYEVKQLQHTKIQEIVTES